MADINPIEEKTFSSYIHDKKNKETWKKTLLWIAALVIGIVLGLLGVDWLNKLMDFIATVYTRLFKLLAVPTIVLSVITTFATFGSKGSGKIFGHTIVYTLLTTFSAAIVAAVLFVLISPGNLPADLISKGDSTVKEETKDNESYYNHILGVIPDNIIRPFLEGNVLSLLILAFAGGIGLSKLSESENKDALIKILKGLQELLFLLIRGLIWTLPLGIIAFAAQLSAQLSAGIVADSIGKYVIVVLVGNAIQFFIVLPIFLLIRRLNPIHVFRKMTPALLMALFTKSSAATLPVTMNTAEQRLGVKSKIARFVLPICTTINMNGCAAFILATSLFVLKNGGTTINFLTILLWILISVVSAIGNAGVPMGCYFLTLSLMTGVNAPVGILGIILPIYTIIDMIETAENVWSDSCVCAMVDHDIE
ncbi:sodium:dicarboxylate symporter family protein [Neocallimastix lanati (nom. inval.)]|uniref:Amino acid transporter n=1 Tax=Neocallimastix californiae TaxID=1754190 RepID=A0A1Y2DIB8_9FUNG|nr:sodium:dicarboxylate symporter family protein [Neocallimastix sp. JGI-2020a]ORY58982.1 sodium:dicarboxylate symporter family protein [Neocallimastix californiae]|eukprot:ORY58982.1 sodium:dicarboxylate symporter family protein [Neocallimastix californiae]